MKSFREYLQEAELMESNPAVGDVFELEIAREEIVLESYVVDVLEDGIVIEADDTMMRILTHVGYLNENSLMLPADETTSPINGKKDALRRRKKDAREFNFETSADDDLTEQQDNKAVMDYPHVGTGISPDMQMAIDIARMKAKTNMMRTIHGDTFQDKPLPDYDEDKIQLAPGEKPGTYQATIKMRQRPPQTTTNTNEAKYQGREVPLGKKMAGDVKKSKVYVRGPKGNVVKVNFGDPNMKIKKSNPARRKSFRARHNCANPGPRWKARYWSCRSW
jgi:hypothetical protein